KISSGDENLAQKEIEIVQENFAASNELLYEVNDKVQVTEYKNELGETFYYVTDFVRSDKLLILGLMFTALVITVTRFQGFNSIFGMGFSFLIILKLLLPQILAGTNPVFISILGAGIIIPITFLHSHGCNKKTGVAILGTLITL